MCIVNNDMCITVDVYIDGDHTPEIPTLILNDRVFVYHISNTAVKKLTIRAVAKLLAADEIRMSELYFAIDSMACTLPDRTLVMNLTSPIHIGSFKTQSLQ